MGDPHASGDRHSFGAEIDEQHLDLSAVVGVDCAGRIEHSEPVTCREAGTRPHLAFMVFGKRDRDAGRDERAAAGRNREWLGSRHRSQQIEAGGMGALIGRQRQIVAVRQAL